MFYTNIKLSMIPPLFGAFCMRQKQIYQMSSLLFKTLYLEICALDIIFLWKCKLSDATHEIVIYYETGAF